MRRIVPVFLGLLLGLFLGASLAPLAPIAARASGTTAAPVDSLRAANTMTVVWRKDIGRSVAVPPILFEDRLFVVTTDGRLFALALDSGKKLWARRVREGIESAALVAASAGDSTGPRLVLGLATGEVRALDPIEGETLWKVNQSSPIRALESDGRRIFALTKAGSLLALSAENGSTLWKQDGLGHDPPAPLVAGPRVITAARADSVFAWDAENGGRIWAAEAPGWHRARPVLHGGELIVAASDGSCLTLALEDGAVRARRNSPSLLLEAPLSAGSFLITISSDGRVFGSADDGREWSRDLRLAVGSPASVMGRQVLLGARDGTLFALRADRGDIAWSLHLHGGLRVPPLAFERLLILATDEGELYVYAREG